MKIDRAELVAVLESLSPLASADSLTAYSRHAAFLGDKVLATDTVVWGEMDSPLDIVAALNVPKWLALLKSMKHKKVEITVDDTGGRVQLKAPRHSSKHISTVLAESFPERPSPSGKVKAWDMDAEEDESTFCVGLEKCAALAAQAGGEYGAVYLSEDGMYATDRYRACRFPFAFPHLKGGKWVVLHLRYVDMLRRWGVPESLRLEGGIIEAVYEDRKLSGRFREEEFSESLVELLHEGGKSKFSPYPDDLGEALSRLALVRADTKEESSLKISKGGWKMAHQGVAGEVSENLVGKYDMETPLDLEIYSGFFAEAIGRTDQWAVVDSGDAVRFYFRDEDTGFVEMVAVGKGK